MILSIHFGRFDPSAKADGTVTLRNTASWSRASDLETDGIQVGDFMTCEDNFVILDGTKTEWPNNTELHHWGLFSGMMSDANGNLPIIPRFEVAFTVDHKSPGLTLLFYPANDDYAKVVRVTWYNAAGAIIQSGTYTLTGNIGTVEENIDGFRRIMVEFLSTSIPYRYVKLYGLEYGITEVFGDEMIHTAQLSENVNPISDTLEANRFRFSIKTHNAAFSLLSGNVEDNMLMKHQKLDLVSDGEPYGTFFLDEWSDSDGSEVFFEFDNMDAIELMEKYRFFGGLYSNYPVTTLLNDIFAVAFPTGLIGYQLDPALQSVRMTGYMPILDCRQALQHVCFAIGAIADTSRRNYVWIYPRDVDPEFTLPLDRVYTRSPVAPTDYYSGVDLTYYSYQQISDVYTVFNGVKPVGRDRIEFSQPLWGVTVTGASVVATHINYVDINVTTQGTVTVTGKGYRDNASVYSLRDNVAAGEVESNFEASGVGLINLNNVSALATNIFQYLKYRVRMNLDMRIEDLEVGMVGDVITRRKPVRGILESLVFNPRSGRANAAIVGSIVED